MSNSVVFLLIAVGLSMLGTLVVWLHGRPRRSRSSVDVFNRSLRALSTNDSQREPLSGVTVRPIDDSTDADAEDPVSASHHDADQPRARAPRPSPRPTPRSAAARRPRASREGADPGT
jgi:hypothetical protein